jgi:hypothetical protein
MDEMELIAQKRAFPSRGRARINSEDLARLGVEEGALIEIGAKGGAILPVAVFADYLVEPGTIRVGGEDLEKLGIAPGTKLVVRKKPLLAEQVKEAARRAAEGASAGIERVEKAVGPAVQDAADRVSAGVASAEEAVAPVVKSAAENVSAGMDRAGEVVGPVVKSGADTVAAGLGKAGESVSSLIEAAKRQLRPGDAAVLERLLKTHEGAITTASVPPGVPLRKIQQLAIPSGAVIVAVQRGDSVEIPGPTLVLLSGDKVYLAGKREALEEAARAIGA